ncbi:hypothetical protein C6N75_02420 [Streptomyces solincola]|uniref:CBS domain-containing protein n=1 Tax=Streptomyces solincola TaxID=2100817 RepID=A0A2S9Q283_9ACTN|nr:CBS domain-containing protein [Streptomyces solincola]PRH80766.1 hypothetical protein C6N75_02420 [Streptomyces solincola]
MNTANTSFHTVGEVMSHAAVAVGQDAPFRKLVGLMAEWKVSAVPVLAGDGRVVGVVSEADLLGLGRPSGGRTAERRRVSSKDGDGACAADLMSAPAVTVHPDAPLAEAARIMARRRVKRLPVVDDEGVLRGVVSRGDLLKVFLRPDEDLRSEIREEVLARLPGCESLDVEVVEGVATVTGPLGDRTLVPLLARAVCTVEGVVDVRFALSALTAA